MQSRTYTSVSDTCITVPPSFNLNDGSRFIALRVFAPKGSRIPAALGEIHDPVAGPIALVNTHEFRGQQIIAVDSLSQSEDRYWGRIYDPAQDLREQIELVTIIALKGVTVDA